MATIPDVTLTVHRIRNDSLETEGRTVELPKNPCIAGRSTDCDVVFKDRTVSRIHIRIDRSPERLSITNLSQKSPTIVDGSTLSPGERFESSYRNFRVILGTVQLKLECDEEFINEDPDFSEEMTLDTDIALVNETLDLPEIRSVAAAQDRKHARDEGPAFIQVVESRAACTISIRGQWLDLPRMTGLALGCLCKNAGVPVAEEVIERAADSESMVTKHVSLARSAIREMIERGSLDVEEIYRQMRAFPDFRDEDIEAWDLNTLMRKFIASRRGFGYILYTRPEDVLVKESR
jgi:hypothetical protein